MPRSLSLPALLLLFACAASPLAAQAPASRDVPGRKSVKTEAKVAEDPHDEAPDLERQQALDVLQRLSKVADEIRDEQIKVRVQARVADALWDYDRERARELFKNVFKSVVALKEEKKNDSAQYVKDLSSRFRLRSEVVRLVSRRDADLAEELIKTLSDDAAKDTSAGTLFNTSDQSTLYLEAALVLAESNPAVAAQLARQSLSFGINPKLVAALRAIQNKERTAADELFAHAMSAAQRDPARYSVNISLLAPYLFPYFGQGFDLYSFGVEAALGPGQSNPALINQFLNFAHQMLAGELNSLQAGAAKNQGVPDVTRASIAYAAARMIQPYFDQLMPDKAAAIRAASAQLSAFVAREQVDALDALTNTSTVDDLLKKADDVKQDSFKDAIYAQAALLATRGGDAEKGLSIAGRIKDERLRSDFDSIVRYEAATAALKEDDAETAYRYAKDVSSVRLSSELLSRVARQFFDKRKDPQRATAILTGARDALSRKPDAPDKIAALLTLTGAMSRIDPASGFDFMRSAVSSLNTADTSGRLKEAPSADGPQSVTALMTASLGLMQFNFDEALTPLARTNLQNTLSLAQSIAPKDISVLAQLSACRAVLTKPKVKRRVDGEAKSKTGAPEQPQPAREQKPPLQF